MIQGFFAEIPYVLKEVLSEKTSNVLIIGDKTNKYSILIREKLSENSDLLDITIDGLKREISEMNDFDKSCYDNVFYHNNINEFDFAHTYDSIIFCNQLQHYDYETGSYVLKKLISQCNKNVVVTTPIFTQETAWALPNFSKFNFTYLKINPTNMFVFYPFVECMDASYKVIEKKEIHSDKPLTIAYLLPHKNLTGGLKMLLQQMQYLKNKGHIIYAVFKTDEKAEKINIDWVDLHADKEIIIPTKEDYMNYLWDCDIIVVGWVTQLLEIKQTNIPVVYWEQGNEWLFGDNINGIEKNQLSKILKECYLSKHYVLSVSEFVSDFIKSRFGRITPVLTNGIDTEFYNTAVKKDLHTILLVGNPTLEFKGFVIAIQALNLVSKLGYKFEVKWACQIAPTTKTMDFPIKLFVKPSQEELAQLYAQSTIHIFTSWYEGFGMPPLEAMACETAVICTRCGGVDDYIKNYYNALTVNPGDIRGLASYIILLLNNEELRKVLVSNGRKTALEHDYSKVINELEQYLYNIVEQNKATN